MALRQIRTKEDPILRKKSKVVTDFNEKLHTLLDDMRETMQEECGVGLAAVQIGELKRVFVIEIDDKYVEFINPEIVSKEGSVIFSEGCLSIPGETYYTERPEKVVIKAQDRHGKEFTMTGEELMAIAMCHENDHLDGILYIDNIIPEDELEDME